MKATCESTPGGPTFTKGRQIQSEPELKCKAKKESKKEVKSESESETCESNCGGSVFSKEDKWLPKDVK